MIERPFGYDPLTGIRETFQFDPSTGESKIITSMDHQPIQEMSHELRKLGRGPGGGKWKGDFVQFGALPIDIYMQKVKLWGTPRQNPAAWKKFWNDRDQLPFRTRLGRV